MSASASSGVSAETIMDSWQQYLADAPPPAFPRRVDLSSAPTPDTLVRRKIKFQGKCPAKASVRAIILTAWALVNVHYSDAEDVVFGLAMMDQDQDQAEGEEDEQARPAAPFRFCYQPNQLVGETLASFETGEFRPHYGEAVSLESIGQLGPDMLNATKYDNQLVIEGDASSSTSTPLDRVMNVEVSPTRAGINVQAFFDLDCVGRDEMQRILCTFEHMVLQLAEPSNATIPLGSLSTISKSDLSQIVEWNNDLPPPSGKCLHELIAQSSEETPSAEAVCGMEMSFSYKELSCMSDRLAKLLISAHAVKPGKVVPFMFDKNPLVVPTLLGILKTGASFVPFDPAHQPEDTARLLQACDADFAVCSQNYEHRFKDHNTEALVIDAGFFEALPVLDIALPAVDPNSPAYVIFTSGSTGVPKGIICSHSAASTNILAHGPRETNSSESRVLAFSAFTFDISITDIFTTLSFGGTLCVPSDHEKMNDLTGAIRRMHVNHLVTTPTVAQFLDPETVPTLQVLVTGGEAMTDEFIELWADRIRLFNSYGPAECTSRASSAKKSRGDKGSVIGTNMGSALWVTQSSDPNVLLPIGAVGELVVEGNILADGYLKNPAKTEETFIKAPQWLKDAFPQRASGSLYRTGDLVQQKADGSLIFIGRRDTQIKIHGVRLEAGHIEAKIKQELPSDANVVVDKILIGGDERPKQMLAAFITLPSLTPDQETPGIELVPANPQVQDFVFQLHKTLVATLPSYMVPNFILPLIAIPLGSTGKTNRKGLQAFAKSLPIDKLNQFTGSTFQNDGRVEKPFGDVETALSNIWASILRIPQDSIHRQDGFFALGGDSVSAMKLVAEAANHEYHITVADIFQHSTLAELAQVITGTDAATTRHQLDDIDPFELIGGPSTFRSIRDQLKKLYRIPVSRVEDVYPTTATVEGMMAENINSPEAYLLQEVLKLADDVDIPTLEAAIEAVVEAYPIMRTRIVHIKGLGTCQVVMTDDDVPDVAQDDDLTTFLSRDKSNHMSYGDALSRFSIIQEPSGNRYLVWTCHHAITDGHMNQDAIRRIEMAYNEQPLPATLQYNQFTKYLMDKDTQDAEDFWAGQFAGSKASSFPQFDDSYEPSVTDYVTRVLSLPRTTSKYTTSIVIRAAWALVLSHVSNSSDVLMGSTQSGRDMGLPGVHECLGPCLGTVPVRIVINRDENVSSFLSRVQKQYLDMIPYQLTGLQHIRKASEEAAEAIGFHNILVVQPTAENNSALFHPDESRNTGDMLNFGLLLECILGQDDVQIRAGFDKNILSPTKITILIQTLEHALKLLMSDSNATSPLSDLDIEIPLDFLVPEGFNPEVEPLEQCMHWMIEEQGRKQPEALMVDSWDAQLTYREANEYSDRLAGVLVGLGVGPETIVPFAFEKSAWATVAIHAILKAGGCCVALDMAHPRARHEKIVADTEAQVIVASSKHAANIDLVPHVIAVDRLMLDSLPPRPDSTRIDVSPSNAAWIVYSSGSTGTPKGSILEHRSLCTTSRTNSDILSVGPSTRAIQFASFSFDVAIEENTIIPMYGGCVCIPSDEERLNDLPGAMRRLEVNWADLTPTVGRMLNPENVPCLRTLVLGGESLTKDIIETWGGKIDLFNTYGPSECSIQCTSSKPLQKEATGANIGWPANCKLWVVDPEEPNKLLPFGEVGELLIEGPIVGRGYLKEATKTAAAFISGLSWAPQGSLLEPRRFYRTGDIAKFNPDGSLDCLGRRDNQVKLNGQRIELGEIEYNITKQLRVPESAQVAVEVFSPGGSASRKLLAAFIQFQDVKASELAIMAMSDALRGDLDGVRTRISQKMPEYMVPALWVPVFSLPINTSGKIDRKKLREAAASFDRAQLNLYSLAHTAKETAVAAFSSNTEAILADLWATVLQIDVAKDPISPTDSFLDLGGDSITAMQLVGKARVAGLALSVPSIMKAPKLVDMALAAKRIPGTGLAIPKSVSQTFVESASPSESESEFEDANAMPLPEITLVREASIPHRPMSSPRPNTASSVRTAETIRDTTVYRPFQMLAGKLPKDHILKLLSDKHSWDPLSVLDAYPTTALQEGLISLTASDGNSYVLRDVYELPADIDLEAFKTAWEAIVGEYDILRTRVVFLDGVGSCQVVRDESIQWKSANDLESYLTADRSEPMGYGTALARYAIVQDGPTRNFVWTVHHALYDGYSMDLTMSAVDQVYAGTTMSPTRPFRDFIRHLQQVDAKAMEAFWQNQLRDLETAPFPAVPAGHRSQADTTVTHSMPFSFDRRAGFNMASLLKAAWSIAVSRMSDSKDVIFGVTQSGRDLDLEGIDIMNGPTINTVPVRIRADPQLTVQSFISQIQSQGNDMIKYSHVGLQGIKRISDATRDACEFQNLIVIQPREMGEQPSSVFRNHKTATTADYLSGFALVLECAIGDGEISFSAHHDYTAISSAQIERLLQQLEHLLYQLQDRRNGKLEDMEMFCSADRQDLSAWNGNYPKTIHQTMHDIIVKQAAATPDALAIASREVELSYKELDDLTNHLAHQIQALGIGPEDVVPICIEKSPEAVLSMISILKSGGAFVPLDPQNPVDRLLDLIDQVEAKVVVFSEQTKHLIPTLAPADKITSIILPTAITAWGPLKSDPVESQAKPSNLAYALFTSGSTGRPKAVAVHHLSVASSTYGHGMAMGFADHPKRTLQFASYTFDACIAEIFTALHFGGCICIPTEHERMNDLSQFIRDFKCDWAFFTPSFVRLLKPEDIPSMTTVVLGGEALNQECINVWGDKVRLMNGYGPTETCVFTVTRTIPGPNEQVERRHKAETIGHPVSSIGWVVDPNNHERLTPVGCVGELLIQGPNVSRGYLKNPEKTAEVFVGNPKWLRAFGHTKPELLYKTGDLVRQDVTDATLTYLGRKDNQTKVNGQRLELGEIETQLKLKGADVESAIVLAGKTKVDKSKQTLAAFIEFQDGTEETPGLLMKTDDELRARFEELDSAMRATLPRYMVPSLWIPVSKMPIMAASGKTDRKCLKSLFDGLDAEHVMMYSLEASESSMAAPREASTDIEKTMLELVARTLATDPAAIHVNDSFFRLGGDSITAIQLVAAARSAGITLSTEDIFRHKIIASIAANIQQDARSGWSANAKAVVPFSLVPKAKLETYLAAAKEQHGLDRESIADLLPCTPLQEGMLFLTIKDPEAYVLREVYRLPSKIDIARFKAAWEQVIQDVELLRTRIVSLGEDGCFQVVMTQQIEWHTSTKVQEYIDGDKQHHFGFGSPLARFAIIETQYTGCYFIWSIHHSLYDGWAKTLIMQKVEQAYRGMAPQLSISPPFNRFIKYLQGTDASEEKAYWTAQFSGLEAQSYPRLPSAAFEPIIDQTITIKIPLMRKPDSSFTLGTILKAAYATVLGRYTGANDALFGVIQTGRNVPIEGISDMIGPTITTVPLRIQLDSDVSVAKFLDVVQTQATEMIRFEHTGLQHIAKMSGECREACAFQNIMVIQPDTKLGSDFLGAQSIDVEDKGFLRFGMGLECVLQAQSIEITGGYDQRLISKAQMSRLLFQLRTAVQQLSEEPDMLVRDIDIVSPEDMAEMADMNEELPEDIHDLTHDVIHSMAMQRSDSMAVNAWDVDFKYSELDQLSTKLAHHLKTLGIGAETVVPLCFEKSGWAVVSVLGVMKSGAAFTFLDPAYPMARLNEIIHQVKAKVILASLDQAPLWRNSSVPVLIIDNVSIESLPTPSRILPVECTPQNVLYVIFTSGSTGKPKGCVIEHHSFLTCARAQAARSGMTESSRVLQGASYSFDVSVMEMLTALTVGACVCVPNERIKKRSVVDVINDFRITWAFLTPSVVKFIKPSDIPHLKMLVLGGEALTTQNIKTWAQHLTLINGYGPSECTIAATANRITNPDEDPANIGKALGGICWIADPDDHNKLAPLGTIGELLIEGSIVFVENPTWAKTIGGKLRRLYKTGDLAYFNVDGYIMFCGRKDTQVKVRGQRMELGEIETHLTLNKNIQHAMVMYPKAGPCRRQLVGIVSIAKLGATTNSNAMVEMIDSHQSVSAAEEMALISAHLATVVPTYMVPQMWIVIRSFPLLPSGKLNRKRVEQWLVSMDNDTHQRIGALANGLRVQGPTTLAEQKIHKVWVEVLKLPAEEIGVGQEFTSLGGDSILAMVVVSKLRAEGFQVTMTDVASARTISQLASRIAREDSGANQLVSAFEDPIEELFDLSPVQQYYANHALNDDYLSNETNKRFNHTFCLTVKKPLDAALARQALEALITRHSMLRVRFQKDATAPCGWKQYISPDFAGSHQFRSWEDTTLEEVKPSVEETRQSLNMEDGPIMAADLVTINEHEQYLFIVAHHLVVDLVSWNTILKDLEEYLATSTFTSEAPYPFQAWVKKQKEYTIRNFPPEKALPVRIPKPNYAYWAMDNRINISKDTEHSSFTLPERDTKALLTACQKLYGAEPMDILSSAMSHAFSYIFRDRSTPPIMRYNHGRESIGGVDVSGTVGWFTTLSPLHIAVHSRDDSIAVLRRGIETRKKLPMNGLGYFASRYYHPGGRAAFACQDRMEVSINYLGVSDGQARNDNEAGGFFDMSQAIENGLGADGQEVKCFSLVSVSAEVREGRFHIQCVWNKHMKAQPQIRKWLAGYYEQALKDVAYRAAKALQAAGVAEKQLEEGIKPLRRAATSPAALTDF
ncbi:Phenylalanine racemase (ATP-hydrolyzing) [Apiospora marii]|uniref:Phenylalanine racemase (ATP-hydrolyzing) n=1 Tax=Apiospora marii TaxID=335849 RepID=A0ABR1RLS5_9PEZI